MKPTDILTQIRRRTWIRAFVIWMAAAGFLAVLPRVALAWDAGPAECALDPCSGGKTSHKFLDTQPKYANSVVPGRLADCPAGYHNIGIGGCGRPADSISAPSVLPSCPSGYVNGGPAGCVNPKNPFDWVGNSHFVCPNGYFKDSAVQRCHKVCPADYVNTGETCLKNAATLGPSSFICGAGERLGGGLVANKCFPHTATNPGPCSEDREEYGASGASLCFTKCPPGSKRTALSTCEHEVMFRGNTHLFVVLNGLELLKSEPDPIAQRIYKVMTSPTCVNSWKQGLWDADDGTLADNASGTKGSHFYNGAGKDAAGNPISTVTYAIAGSEQGRDANARVKARERTDKAGDLKTGDQCHDLGIALHYVSDMTQPMHATSYSGMDMPLLLHPTLEDYVPSIQKNYPPNRPWDKRWKGKNPDETFHEISVKSASLAPALMKTLAYDGTICTIRPEAADAAEIATYASALGAVGTVAGAPTLVGAVPAGVAGAITGGVIGAHVYTGKCFVHDAAVDAQLGTVLRDGYQSVASYLYAVSQVALKDVAAAGVPEAPKNLTVSPDAAPAQAPAASTGTASLEQQCFDSVQGKVAWDRAGAKTWNPANIQNLCKATKEPSATISCFQAQIAEHGDWVKAIAACQAH